MTDLKPPAVSPRPVLVARCENFIEDDDFDGTPCLGRIHFRWGQSQAACDTCGAYCGVAVAAWERVETAGEPGHPAGCPSCSGMLTDRDCDDRRPVRALLATDTTPAAGRG